MALVSVIHRTRLGNRNRLDPEYYEPEYLQINSVLSGRTCRKLSTLSREINCGPFGSTVLCDTYTPQGILVIRPFNIKDLRVDDQEIVYVSQEDVKTKNLKTYANGDIVFSRVGDIRCGIIDNLDGQVTISPNIIAVKLKKHLINPYFVCTFMNTKYGYMQLERTLKIVAQPTIETETVKELLIPQIGEDFQSDIEHNVKLAFSWQDSSKLLYSQAENLLLEELGLKDFKPKYELSYTANLSQAFGAGRADAEYFQPVYDGVIDYFKKNFLTDKLRNISSFLNHGKQPPYVESGGVPVLIQKHMGRQHLNLDALSDPDTPETNLAFINKHPEYRLRFGDVVFYSVGAYLGRTNVLLEEIESVPASFITLIRIPQEFCNSVYLALFLNSQVGRLQSERWKSASAQQYIYPKEIGEFVIPLLPNKTQQEIASLVQQSHKARKIAKQLLEEAKGKVEQMVETASLN